MTNLMKVPVKKLNQHAETFNNVKCSAIAARVAFLVLNDSRIISYDILYVLKDSADNSRKAPVYFTNNFF